MLVITQILFTEVITVESASGTAIVRFTPSQNNGGYVIQRYDLRYWTDPQSQILVLDVQSGHLLTNLTNELTCTVQVRAVTLFAIGEWSGIVSFII